MKRLRAIDQAIFKISDGDTFNASAMEIFHEQYVANPVYRRFCDLLGRNPDNVRAITEIPFLPIELFKNHDILTGDQHLEKPLVFRSSGTTATGRSQHILARPEVYETSYLRCFEQFYGKASEYRILALLPSYLEQGDSSLVYMVRDLIERSGHPESGFFLDNRQELKVLLSAPCAKPTLLIGVSYALLDLAEEELAPLKNTIVMETGGMKGRRRELTRAELHATLAAAFGVSHIHSEYGMTELLSQAYAKKDGLFETPPWMRLYIREVNDPLTLAPTGRTGGINVIDLANRHSCSFIATSDLGRAMEDGRTEILGRFDFSDIRGCNLMAGM